MGRSGKFWTLLALVIGLSLSALVAGMLPTRISEASVVVESVPVAQVAAAPQQRTEAANESPPAEPTPEPSEPEPRAPQPQPRAPQPSAPVEDRPLRVGLQVGHLRSNELPDELARLRTSTGARYGNITEAQLNEAIVLQIVPILEAAGVIVDVIPATVPPSYSADAFLAIHADGSTSPRPRGWKLATPWRASPASKQLYAAVHATYGAATGLPEDVNGLTANMRGYYAFNFRRYEHAIASTTPAIIVEMGYMTNAADRVLLFEQQDRVVRGIADGVLNYLANLDRSNPDVYITPDYPSMVANEGAVIRVAPNDNARIRSRLNDGARLFIFDQRDGYYELFVRGSGGRQIGWVREDQVRLEAPPPEDTPPADDSADDSNP
jgi:N-acetylmuramoyl-L-alanine amidase